MKNLVVAFVLAVLPGSGPAHAERNVIFAESVADGDALVLMVSDFESFDSEKALLGDALAARVKKAAAAQKFDGKAGSSASIFTGDDRFPEVHLMGFSADGATPRKLAETGGKVAALAGKSKADRLAIVMAGSAADAADVALGFRLRQYAFDKYQEKKEDAATGEAAIVTPAASAARQLYNTRQKHLADAVNWMRDMQSEPANVLYPEEFVQRSRALMRGLPVSIEVLDERDFSRLGMGAIAGVGQGSVRPPRMLIVRYNGGSGAPVAIVGKGITFDSGGISIKSNSGMWSMKADMSGAAAVIGAAYSLAASKAPVNVVAVAALAENMPSGSAQRPGDVVRSMSGKTIEILSTDAEGRLVLSDAVWYVQEQDKPRPLVDIATLTGAVIGALSAEYAGLFTKDDDLASRIEEVGLATGDEVWRLPLHPNHYKQIKSDIADVKNSDTGSPGASTGAAFIGAFIKDETPWAHLDIAGVDNFTSPTDTTPKGFSGYGVRLLDELVRREAGAAQ